MMKKSILFITAVLIANAAQATAYNTDYNIDKTALSTKNYQCALRASSYIDEYACYWESYK